MGLAGAHVTGGDGNVSMARIDHFGVVPGPGGGQPSFSLAMAEFPLCRMAFLVP